MISDTTYYIKINDKFIKNINGTESCFIITNVNKIIKIRFGHNNRDNIICNRTLRIIILNDYNKQILNLNEHDKRLFKETEKFNSRNINLINFTHILEEINNDLYNKYIITFSLSQLKNLKNVNSETEIMILFYINFLKKKNNIIEKENLKGAFDINFMNPYESNFINLADPYFREKVIAINEKRPKKRKTNKPNINKTYTFKNSNDIVNIEYNQNSKNSNRPIAIIRSIALDKSNNLNIKLQSNF